MDPGMAITVYLVHILQRKCEYTEKKFLIFNLLCNKRTFRQDTT
jgi:hypothetical protein